MKLHRMHTFLRHSATNHFVTIVDLVCIVHLLGFHLCLQALNSSLCSATYSGLQAFQLRQPAHSHKARLHLKPFS